MTPADVDLVLAIVGSVILVFACAFVLSARQELQELKRYRAKTGKRLHATIRKIEADLRSEAKR